MSYPPAGGYAQPAPQREHPEGTKVLILGSLGLVACQILAPFAWVIGNRVVKEIDAAPGGYSNRSLANAGRICGMVGSILWIVFIFIYIAIFALLLAGDSSSAPRRAGLR
ncbi:MAG: DUF4190 domain-containing protein [Iamia sp.]